MVSAGLPFTAACILLISVQALSIQDLQCAYEETNEDFCEYVQDAHGANAEALSKLNKLKPKPLFAGDRKKLRDANRLILELLKKKVLKDLLIVFEKVLKAELQAMHNLTSHCCDERLEGTVKAKCEQAREDVGEAIEEMIHSLTELPLVQNSTLAMVANDAYMMFEKFYTISNLEGSYANEAAVAATRVLDAIRNQNKAEKGRSV